MSDVVPDLRALAAALPAPLGADALDGSARIDAVPVPGARATCVWHVVAEDPDHPLHAYVGAAPGGAPSVLNDDQPAFLRVVGDVGVELRDAVTVLAYVKVFLEVTRGPAVLVAILSGPDDIPWRPGSELEEAQRLAFTAEHEVPEPSVTPTSGGWRVTAHLLVDQRIQHNVFEVTREGRITASHEVLAANLPLPIAR